METSIRKTGEPSVTPRSPRSSRTIIATATGTALSIGACPASSHRDGVANYDGHKADGKVQGDGLPERIAEDGHQEGQPELGAAEP